jgi:predicted Zn-dependent protease
MEDVVITNAQYNLCPVTNEKDAVKATIDGQEMFVPLDPENRHYAEIMRQVEAGTLTIQEAE